MTTTISMALRHLTSEHLGRTIAIEATDGSLARGLLAGVHHHCLIIGEPRLGSVEERFVVGRPVTSITVAGWGERDFDPGHECDISST